MQRESAGVSLSQPPQRSRTKLLQLYARHTYLQTSSIQSGIMRQEWINVIWSARCSICGQRAKSSSNSAEPAWFSLWCSTMALQLWVCISHQPQQQQKRWANRSEIAQTDAYIWLVLVSRGVNRHPICRIMHHPLQPDWSAFSVRQLILIALAARRL